jgi:hypothetical protein
MYHRLQERLRKLWVCIAGLKRHMLENKQLTGIYPCQSCRTSGSEEKTKQKKSKTRTTQHKTKQDGTV